MHNKFELALEISKEEDAAWFVNMINYLYLVENECIIAELTPEKVKERRERNRGTRNRGTGTCFTEKLSQ